LNKLFRRQTNAQNTRIHLKSIGTWKWASLNLLLDGFTTLPLISINIEVKMQPLNLILWRVEWEGRA